MRYSQSFAKTNKESKEYDSRNATLLIKAGFVDQVMAGVYAFLPLGTRVLHKIEGIVREEMDKIGQEVFLPSIVPTQIWETSGRIDSVDVLFQVTAANEVSREKNDSRYILNPTHEDTLTPIAKKHRFSYKDLPFGLYQIQTKFRNEPRPKSGLMRGREFRMKDLYSFHTSKEDLLEFYEKAKEAYINIFDRLGIGEDTFVTAASGGDFTQNFSHEFQTVCKTGEDTVYKDRETGEYFNKEVMKAKDLNKFEEFKASEVGNIFPLETKFSESFDYKYTDQKGEENYVYMGSYGIGTSRVMGVIVEKFNDENGIIWPEQIAPYNVHLINIGRVDDAEKLYKKLLSDGIEVLWDDRDIGAGQKFSDCDLIGIPYRVVISEKTEDKLEFKKRTSQDTELLSYQEILKQINE